jgi:hypothetical protein
MESVMLYCKRCKSLTEYQECPLCGAKKLREPEVNDVVFLATKNFVNAGMLEDMLKEHNIPCLKKPMFGAGLTARWGHMFETFHIYIPFGALERGLELLGYFKELPYKKNTMLKK